MLLDEVGYGPDGFKHRGTKRRPKPHYLITESRKDSRNGLRAA